MQLVWKFAIGAVVVVLMVRFLVRFVGEARRVRLIEKEVDVENDRIGNLPIEEAEPAARQILSSNATLESWRGAIPPEIADKLAMMDDSIQSVFRDYRRCRFSETGTELCADFLLKESSHDGALQIGADLFDESIQHKLLARPGSPVVIEINEDAQVVEEYPSIYHYLVIVER